jgi:hypothetical protein
MSGKQKARETRTEADSIEFRRKYMDDNSGLGEEGDTA